MRAAIATVVITFALLAGSGEAKAQVATGSVSSAPAVRFASTPLVYTMSPAPSPYVPKYSYFAATGIYPARTYVGIGGAGDFPYYGQPYGHPYELWNWSNLSGDPYGGLARYYYPPVR